MSIFKDFGINPLLLGAQFVNFAILLFLLKRFLYKPVMNVLDERKRKVETSLLQAEEIQRTFEAASKKQQEILEKARSEAAKIVAEAKEEAKILAEQMKKEAGEATQASIKRTQEMLSLEKGNMMNQAKKELVDMVAMVTEKVAATSLKNTDRDKIINEAIKDIKQ